MLHCNINPARPSDISQNPVQQPQFQTPAALRPAASIRTDQMTSPNGTATFSHVVEAAARNFGRGSDLALAAGQIIARRVALGFAAAIDPWQADHDEFHRMVPEKLEVFSTAGMIMLERSSQAGFTMTRLASDEVLTTASATMTMAGCADPLALAEAQGRFALAWLDRASALMIAMGMLALHAHDAVMEPIRDAVAANTARLC
jgi:hypothetical protein